MADEVWKPVVGYEGLYEVSNHGRVKSLARKVKGGRNCPLRFNAERVLRAGLSSNGYGTVVLTDGKAKVSHLVHRLVATAFIPNPMALGDVNHEDGHKLNCRVENLTWCTRSQNIQHAYDTGLIVPYRRKFRQSTSSTTR